MQNSSINKNNLLHVAIVLPNMFAVRNFMETPVLDLLTKQTNIFFTLLTPFPNDNLRITNLKTNHIQWRNISKPVSTIDKNFLPKPLKKLAHSIHKIVNRLLKNKAEFGNLVFRFNHINRFAGHLQKINLSPERKKREAVAGNFVVRMLGEPFPNSKLLFRLLYNTYYSLWQQNNLFVESFINQYKPDLLVLTYIQNKTIKPYSIAARQNGIKTVGIVGSWDKLTTKGPLCPAIDIFAIQNKVMQKELIRFHNIHKHKIEIIGWPQMDFYKNPETFQNRESFFSDIGIPLNHKLIVFGAYSERLGPHEPGIASHIASQIKKNAYGMPCTLLIRPHPKDDKWNERFGYLNKPPGIMVQNTEWGKLNYLTNLLYHADIVLASQGSISVDAIALDTCVINIAFDGDLDMDYSQSIARWYELDHYAPVMKSKSTYLVKSYGELDKAITDYLKNPEMDGNCRKVLRGELLEPFDGKSSERLVSLIIKEAMRASGK